MPIEIKDIKNKNKNNDIFDSLRKLGELHECGVLTNEEFNNKKKELLSKI